MAALGGVGIVVASSACAVDSTTPSQAAPPTPERVSSFVPSAASKALIGVTDGVYAFTINPKADNVLNLGPNRLEIPAWAICNMGNSGYGPEYWNRPCTSATKMTTITVMVTGANTSTPVLDFQPAMRFNPVSKVQLYFYVPQVSIADARAWNILYCGTGTLAANGNGRSGDTSSGSGVCVNEATSDPDLQTYIDYTNSIIFRRIKHFSRYKVDDGGFVVSE